MDSIFKLLSQFTWETKDDIPNSFKCIKCRNIINNTKQIECGCKFCSKCVQDLIENGSQNCPGDTKFCKDSSLSRAFPNYGMDTDISNVVVKCPHRCGHEDKLINMDGHLQICDKKPMKCVFGPLGCDTGNLLTENIQTHLQSECCNHMLMLVNAVEHMKKENENMKKENKKMKAKIENMESENENMKNKNQEQERKIDSMKNEMNLMKVGGKLDWTIDQMGEMRNNKEYFSSKYFYGNKIAYKMSLLMSTYSDSRLNICFYIWDDVRNDLCKWPFQATVTMTIREKETEKSQTARIVLARPENNSFNCHEFNFEYSDLLAANLLVNDCITVECIVEE